MILCLGMIAIAVGAAIVTDQPSRVLAADGWMLMMAMMDRHNHSSGKD